MDSSTQAHDPHKWVLKSAVESIILINGGFSTGSTPVDDLPGLLDLPNSDDEDELTPLQLHDLEGE